LALLVKFINGKSEASIEKVRETVSRLERMKFLDSDPVNLLLLQVREKYAE